MSDDEEEAAINDAIVHKVNELAHILCEANGYRPQTKGGVPALLFNDSDPRIRSFFDIAARSHEFYTGDEVADALEDFKERLKPKPYEDTPR